MNAVRIYAVGVLVSLVSVSVIFAPLLGLPIGATQSTGGSMGDAGPTLNIYVDGEPEVGDVVVYDSGDWGTHQHGVHRVVEETEHGFKTEGDANGFVDQDRGAPYATAENTVGVVLLRVTTLEMGSLVLLGVVGGVLLSRMSTREKPIGENAKQKSNR